MSASVVTARSYFPGMGEAVADRTVNRKIFTEDQRLALPKVLKLNPNDPLFIAWKNAADLSAHPVDVSEQAKFMPEKPETRMEVWQEVATRVAAGNVSLVEGAAVDEATMYRHLVQGSLLMSGRHLQHGDMNQKSRPMEVFTNCSTAAATFLLFYLLLNGSGVGRAYDDAMMKVDWNNAPDIHVVIDANYPDRFKMKQEWNGEALVEMPMIGSEFKDPADLQAIFDVAEVKATWFKVPDSRAGWAKAIEIAERMAFEKRSNEILVLDFSDVRQSGSPIKGMQNRPSSGPGPLMHAIAQIAKIKFLGLAPWEAAMRADHYAAECVLVGGARRAARMATKRWDDETIFDFIAFKRDGGWWSSNNSVTIDQEFRDLCTAVSSQFASFGVSITEVSFAEKLHHSGVITARALHAWKVLHALAEASYFDGTGEPGLINQDRLHEDQTGVEAYLDGLFAGSKDFQVDPESLNLMISLAAATFIGSDYTMITNPCGEIALLMLGGYCVIADVVPFHAQNDDDAEEAFRTAVRALIRTNTMDSLYNREVKRTNRIGVGITGLHEWIYSRFGFTWQDIVNEQKSMPMWLMLSRFKRAIVDEARRYSELLGVVTPHTDTTMKPAGCAALTTTVKLPEGVVTMEELFARHGYDRAYVERMPAGTWLTPMVPMQVLDMENVAKDVTKLYVNGVKDVFEITFEDGTVAKLTGNHKLMTDKGWKRVDELSEDDEIMQH